MGRKKGKSKKHKKKRKSRNTPKKKSSSSSSSSSSMRKMYFDSINIEFNFKFHTASEDSSFRRNEMITSIVPFENRLGEKQLIVLKNGLIEFFDSSGFYLRSIEYGESVVEFLEKKDASLPICYAAKVVYQKEDLGEYLFLGGNYYCIFILDLRTLSFNTLPYEPIYNFSEILGENFLALSGHSKGTLILEVRNYWRKIRVLNSDQNIVKRKRNFNQAINNLPIYYYALKYKEDLLITCGERIAIEMFNWKTGELVKSFPKLHTKGVRCLSKFKYHSKDILVSGGFMLGEIFIWDILTQTVLKKLVGHSNAIESVTNFKNRYLLSIATKGEIFIWKYANLELKKNIPSEIKCREMYKVVERNECPICWMSWIEELKKFAVCGDKSEIRIFRIFDRRNKENDLFERMFFINSVLVMKEKKEDYKDLIFDSFSITVQTTNHMSLRGKKQIVMLRYL